MNRSHGIELQGFEHIEFADAVAAASADCGEPANTQGWHEPNRKPAPTLTPTPQQAARNAANAATQADEPIPATLGSDQPLFEVPERRIRIFDRDLDFAGLARAETSDGLKVVVKTDERGRTIDVHALPTLRHTSGTHLSKAGVPLRTVQAAMRHIDPSLTANVLHRPEASRRGRGHGEPAGSAAGQGRTARADRRPLLISRRAPRPLTRP